MSEVKFSKEHEWIKLEGDVATIGITKHATEMLGDIVFVELPELESKINQDDTFGVVEAVKTVADLFAPVSGNIVEINNALCLLYTSPSPRDVEESRMPSSA